MSITLRHLPIHAMSTDDTSFVHYYYSAYPIDADGEAHACICQVPKTGTITGIVGGCPSASFVGGNLDFRLETVGSSTGMPTDTLWSTNTNAIVNVANANTLYEGTLTSSASVTRGDVIAVVFKRPASSTFTGYMIAGYAVRAIGFPNWCYNIGAGWNKSSSYGTATCFKYNDGSYESPFGIIPPNNTSMLSSALTSVNNRRGFRFKTGPAMTLSGVTFSLASAYTNSMVIELWDSNGTSVLRSVTIPGPETGPSVGNQNFAMPILFSSPVSLASGTYYRATARLSSVTASGYFCKYQQHLTSNAYTAAQYQKMYQGVQTGGLLEDFHRTYCTVSGGPTQEADWTNVSNDIPVTAGILIGSIP